jgi:hypothetical protein
MFTDSELRQAAFALSVIGDKGHPDELEDRILQRQRAMRNTDTIGNQLSRGFLAAALRDHLGEPRARCERAVNDAFGGDWRRARFDAIVAYAAELNQYEPEHEPDIQELYERYGLDAMLDYSCVHGALPDSDPEPERRRETTAKRDKVIMLPAESGGA